jgi:hypothetical protein
LYTAINTPYQICLVEQQFATEWTRANAMMEAAGFTVQYCNKLRGEAINPNI